MVNTNRIISSTTIVVALIAIIMVVISSSSSSSGGQFFTFSDIVYGQSIRILLQKVIHQTILLHFLFF